jgi:uncharacterized protein (DUF1015 family)
MARVVELRPFRAIRPAAEHAARVAAPPYDVVDVAEARALAAGNPDSFLHVSRPEIDLPDDVDPHSDAVHQAGRAALDDLVSRGVLVAEPEASYAVYRQHRGDHVQTGIVGCATVADYLSGTIRTHEHTRPDKEDDRVRHIDALDAHDEPVFLFAAPDDPDWTPIADLIREVTAEPPLVDLSLDGLDGTTRHILWPVAAWADTSTLEAAFAKLAVLYVADGHHRSAAAARVSVLRPGGPPEAHVFPVVVFPGEELEILPYHRVVADLGGRPPAELLLDLGRRFEVAAFVDERPATGPQRRHEFLLYCAGQWFTLAARDVPVADAVATLDVSLLQDRVLGPLLGIEDPRTDQRIGFVGGVRGLPELERLVDSGRWAAAFALHPTSVAELVAVAASGRVMPPKSTWFEPKLRSGLFVHPIG